MVRKQVKSYAIYSPPWWDNDGQYCLDPSFGISSSFIKDKITSKVSFPDVCKKFDPLKLELSVGKLQEEEEKIFADTVSFISQDGLIFLLFGMPEGNATIIWQIYFDNNTRYPPNISDSRKETTAFNRWILDQV